MGRFDLKPGSETIEDFFGFINERHRVFLKKEAGEPKPWTDDPVLQEFKFTNAFRELDRGTIALRDMIKRSEYKGDAGLLAWNIIWYRLFNLDTHATDPGFCVDPSHLAARLRRKRIYGEKIFTAAHMTVGKAGISKLEFMIPSCERLYEDRQSIVDECRESRNLMAVWKSLQKYMGIGAFIAYEIVTDFRWYDSLLSDANDIMFWVNTGPGCRRGLRRLGLAENVRSIRMLWELAPDHLADHVVSHHSKFTEARGLQTIWPPFELREVEHSLCEFDKWCRTRRGEGRPRQRYDGA
jgi:hypothetical protein